MKLVNVTMTWYCQEPLGIYFDDSIIWESNIVAIDTECISSIKLQLPLVFAIKYCSILVQGISADKLQVLLALVTAKIEELKALAAKLKSKQENNDDLLGWN